MFKIKFLIPYFGKFPEWAPLYFETLKRNPSIDFVFYTDCDYTNFKAENVVFHEISFKHYINNAKKRLKISFSPSSPYKLCDLRPLYGILHYDDLIGVDFYGWTDMDLLLGNIRSYYTDEVLSGYEVFSTHNLRISGHMALFKNTSLNRNMYRNIYNWRENLSHPEFVGIDEHGITNAYRMTYVDKFNEKYKTTINNKFSQWLTERRTRKLFMVEQYTTPFTPIPWIDGSVNSNQPDEWYYKDGAITNARDGSRNFMYIHFMNFKNSQWRHDGTKAPWEGKERICFAGPDDLIKGIKINPEGIYPL